MDRYSDSLYEINSIEYFKKQLLDDKLLLDAFNDTMCTLEELRYLVYLFNRTILIAISSIAIIEATKLIYKTIKQTFESLILTVIV